VRIPRAVRAPGRLTPGDQFWTTRLRSATFKQALTRAVTSELHALAGERVADVIDAELVRTFIREWDTRVIGRDTVADLVILSQRRTRQRLRAQRGSLAGLLGRELLDEIDDLLAAPAEPSRRTEEFVATLMQQELVRRLFTDVIFAAIVSFYQRVNPLFGALTTRVLEEQIKGFIGLFMPTLLQRATAFVISATNQRVALQFVRSIVRELLEAPLRSYTGMVAPGRKQAEALTRTLVTDARLARVTRNAALAVWDDLYEILRDQKVGELVRLETHARWLAERSVEIILPLLQRPSVRRFIATEMARTPELKKP
jgi:hypothetical protein